MKTASHKGRELHEAQTREKPWLFTDKQKNKKISPDIADILHVVATMLVILSLLYSHNPVTLIIKLLK
jgi:hypothetical protein